jgi:hypothetical protein
MGPVSAEDRDLDRATAGDFSPGFFAAGAADMAGDIADPLVLSLGEGLKPLAIYLNMASIFRGINKL